MPKEIYNNTDFSGGINGIDSPRDVKDEEVISAKSVTFDEKGRIRMMGKAILNTIADIASTGFNNPGFESGTSFFHFAHDYSMLIGDSTAPAISSEAVVGGLWDFVASTEVWTSSSNHGLKVGDTIWFTLRGTNPTQYALKTTYYVVSVPSVASLTLSETLDGTALNGTLNSGSDEWTAVAIPSERETSFFALGNQEHVAIWDAGSNYFFMQAIDMGADPDVGARRTKFYFMDGALRCYNSEFNSSVYSRWHGHIKRDLFITSTVGKINEWFTTTTRLMPPSATVFDNTTIGSEYPGQAKIIQTVAIAETANFLTVHAVFDDANSSGTWIDNPKYKMYLSYIYDGSQESSVMEQGSIDSNELPTLYLGITINWYNSGFKFNKRITGGRVYYSDPVDGHGILYQLLDIDFEQGCRKVLEEEWTPWGEETQETIYECPTGIIAGGSDAANFAAVANVFIFEDMPKSVKWSDLNEYGPTEVTEAEFKCHTVFNNRVYVGNISQPIEVGSSTVKTFPDRVISSPVNWDGKTQADTFPARLKMDIAASDGDRITALAGYGDRLLIFKVKSVYVVNVSVYKDEYLETQFTDMGVQSQSQVTVTEYGVIWINSSGCFLYNEGLPTNLIDNKLSTKARFITGSMKWDAQIDNVPVVAYMPRIDKLIVSLGVDGGSNDCWLYDFKKESWSFGGGVLGNWDYERSNFVIDQSGDMYFFQNTGGDPQVFGWNDGPQANNKFKILFKDFDARQPNVRKKFYKAYLQFRSSQATNVIATYVVNGNYDDKKTFDITQDGIESGGELSFSTAQSNLIETNPNFTVNTSGAGLAAVTDGAVLNTDAGWFGREQNDGALAVIADGVMAWKNTVGLLSASTASDLILYQKITVVNDADYILSFSNNSPMIVINTPSINHVYVPATMCYITTASDSPNEAGCSHAELIASGDVKAFVVATTIGRHSVRFTADESNVWFVCFRSVILDIGDPADTFASWDPAENVAGEVFVHNSTGNVSEAIIKQEGEWSTAVLKPNTSSEARNIKSMALRLDVQSGQSVPSDFEIDNISYVYRVKSIK